MRCDGLDTGSQLQTSRCFCCLRSGATASPLAISPGLNNTRAKLLDLETRTGVPGAKGVFERYDWSKGNRSSRNVEREVDNGSRTVGSCFWSFLEGMKEMKDAGLNGVDDVFGWLVREKVCVYN